MCLSTCSTVLVGVDLLVKETSLSPKCTQQMLLSNPRGRLLGGIDAYCVIEYICILASFPGPRPASCRLQYGKRREAGRGPGNEAICMQYKEIIAVFETSF